MFNVRVIHYPDGDRVVLYSVPVLSGDDFATYVDFETGEIIPKKVITKLPDPLVKEFNPFTGMEELMLDIDEVDRRKERSEHESLTRTKRKIYHLARSNHWEWFVTLTFDPEKVDSFDYGLVTQKLSKWLNNLRVRYAPDLKYIIVPELHASGRYHFHGLFAQTGNISFADSGHRTHGNIVYNVGNYQLGFSTATLIQSVSKSTYYITKYISKDFVALTKNKKRYWASKNLASAPVTEFCFEGGEQYKIADQFQDVRYTKRYDLGFQQVDYIDLATCDALSYFQGGMS